MTAPAVAQAVRRRVTVRGTVQGVGFRPFVHRLATDLALAGFVSNTASGVLIEVEGPPEGVADFCDRLAAEPPPLATVTGVGVEDLPVTGADGTFSIRSTDQSPGRTHLPPDTAACGDCLRELADPADRRHRHPFVTCTHCGPRFTIATGMPYDRAVTTMAGFPMCAECAREYGDPLDRRFHAQPVACPDCGPRLCVVPAAGSGVRPARDADALAAARALLAAGRIVAVKGLGGYHLACDATDARAVETLRTRKARGGKPYLFASPHHPPGASGQRLDVLAGRGAHGDGACAAQELVEGEGDAGLARYGLVEGQVRGAVVGAQRLDGALAGVLHLLALHLEVADPHAYAGAVEPPDPQQALGPLVPGVGGAGDAGDDRAVRLDPVPGEQHAELPTDAVLGRGSAVGVEEVALVEDGVGDGAELLETGQVRTAPCGGAPCARLDHGLRHRASSSRSARASLPPRSHRSSTVAASGAVALGCSGCRPGGCLGRRCAGRLPYRRGTAR
ncbi:acylphosphatase [Streptomyces sp. Go-475]|uniref:acylphosphatase n=1 Tax=Streptomyces sp. Go-475 TaxID=2072505 RepID=UPI000DF03727|nr:acylphosphatase [Streptomyces sp. Go-475]AXE83812.1 Carbamoyltransferase HypF [Streptomyces sp. Go-475]